MAAQANALSLEELKEKGKVLRRLIIRMTTEAGSGHPSSSLSAVEVVNALWFGGFMKYDPENPNWEARNGCPVLKPQRVHWDRDFLWELDRPSAHA